jgi:hypothetical protein
MGRALAILVLVLPALARAERWEGMYLGGAFGVAFNFSDCCPSWSLPIVQLTFADRIGRLAPRAFLDYEAVTGGDSFTGPLFVLGGGADVIVVGSRTVALTAGASLSFGASDWYYDEDEVHIEHKWLLLGLSTALQISLARLELELRLEELLALASTGESYSGREDPPATRLLFGAGFHF